MTRLAFAAALAWALASPAPSWAAAPAAPGRERTEAFIATLKKVKQSEGKLSEADKAANARVFAELDGFLDFDTLTSRPIAARADKLSAEQMASFKGKFRELIRLIAFPRAGNFFGKAAWSFQPDKPRGELVQVDLKVKLADEDLETEIQFLWARVGGALKIQDVLFEGDSLMKDYQNQLARIVDRDGVPGLFKKLDDRLAELSKEPKK